MRDAGAARRRTRLDPRLEYVPSDLIARGELRLADAWSVWDRLATRARLDAGDLANLRAVAWRTFDGEVDALSIDELPELLDWLEADARSRRPMFILEELVDGRLALVVDVEGDRDNLAAELPTFRTRADQEQRAHRARRIDELRRGPDRPSLKAIARRLGLSLASLKRLKTGVEMSRFGSNEGPK